MKCPVCRHAMLVYEMNGVEADFCPSCRGMWLDRGELELLLKGSAEADRLISSMRPARSSGEKPRPCPICSRRMDKVLYGGQPPVCLDRCVDGHGLWLDAGELDALVGQSALSGDELPGFLGDITRNQHKGEGRQ